MPRGNLLLLGPRRSGKTTLAQQRFHEHGYVTLDDFDYLTWARKDPKGMVGSLRPKAIIDEVQRCPELTVAAKYWIDRGELEVLMTGSSSLGLLDAVADTMAGRMHIVHLPTFCWGEDLGPPAHRFFEDTLTAPELAECRRRFPQALRYGGFPEVALERREEAKSALLRLYRDTFFLRDLAQLSNVENVEALLTIYHYAIRSLGSPLEYSNFAREAGLSHATAKRYLGTLLQSELAFRVYGYQYGAAKRYVKAGKLYLADSGMLPSFQQDVSAGHRFEQFVVSELEKRRKLGYLPADCLMFQRSASGAEIDLIIEEPALVRAIEIKASEKVERKDARNLRRFLEMPGPKPRRGYLVYLGDEYRDLDGVLALPVYALCRAR